MMHPLRIGEDRPCSPGGVRGSGSGNWRIEKLRTRQERRSPGGIIMLKEFKEFAMRGNVVDMAVGIVVGAAFGGIVTSLVNDMLMPPIGLLLGKVDFSNLFITLSGRHFDSLAQAKGAGAATLNYGLFMNTVINFVIVAFAVFLLVRQVNRLRPKPAPPPALHFGAEGRVEAGVRCQVSGVRENSTQLSALSSQPSALSGRPLSQFADS